MENLLEIEDLLSSLILSYVRSSLWKELEELEDELLPQPRGCEFFNFIYQWGREKTADSMCPKFKGHVTIYPNSEHLPVKAISLL